MKKNMPVIAWDSALRIPARFFIHLFVLLGLFACQGNGPQADSATGRPDFVDATFVDCVFYAGATKYFFQGKDGKEFVVVQSHEPDAMRIRNAENLLEPDPVEGPPGPNAEILGKQVRIHYDEQGRPVAFSLPKKPAD